MEKLVCDWRPFIFTYWTLVVMRWMTSQRWCWSMTSLHLLGAGFDLRHVFYFFATREFCGKHKTTFSQFLVEASFPWHRVNSNVRKQTWDMSFTFISARINKIQLQYHSYQYWIYTKIQKRFHHLWHHVGGGAGKLKTWKFLLANSTSC